MYSLTSNTNNIRIIIKQNNQHNINYSKNFTIESKKKNVKIDNNTLTTSLEFSNKCVNIYTFENVFNIDAINKTISETITLSIIHNQAVKGKTYSLIGASQNGQNKNDDSTAIIPFATKSCYSDILLNQNIQAETRYDKKGKTICNVNLTTQVPINENVIIHQIMQDIYKTYHKSESKGNHNSSRGHAIITITHIDNNFNQGGPIIIQLPLLQLQQY
ncbi:hypothetical protein RFI_21656 [Reticulomyxa filosa]|uniref:Uncharacterized protein n=1 Tax=Reticulomyxa filosa TaxID=46433 RepID=X6MRG5_RETFI|nr:hypothetical protein RFI_21656 [Reticulomyxa filosa]|eukprot:ETO15700.1 hypothetical protein RFI_21656 [Reticulomyxa filosa]